MKQKANAIQRLAVGGKQAWRPPRSRQSRRRGSLDGFTLLELVITITVLSILTLGAVPLVKVAVRRQKEQQLRETLREIRIAIDQFHREAVAAPISQTAGGRVPNTPPNPAQAPMALDPRVRVYISDQTLFTVDNSDRYPPTIEALTDGVDVLPFAQPQLLTGGQGLNNTRGVTESQTATVPKKKVYLRTIPVDPITGKADWEFRSCYQPADDTSWDGINIFDVRSKAQGTALNGEKYSDW